MSTTYPIRPIIPSNPVGASNQIYHGLEEASMTFNKGAILVADGTSKEVEEAGADDQDILGVAVSGASGTAGTDVMFYPADGSIVFEGTLLTDDDDDTDDEIAATDAWTKYGLVLDAGEGYWVIDKGETTNVRVVIVGFRDPVATVNGRVYFKFLNDETVFSQVQT
jgi:hypothetical protein